MKKRTVVKTKSKARFTRDPENDSAPEAAYGRWTAAKTATVEVPACFRRLGVVRALQEAQGIYGD